MRVFISWSGLRAQHVAHALRGWLPKVIQNLKPWASSTDIDKGARWLNEITLELRASQFGLICVTPENQLEPWLLYEAGALSNALGLEFVAPILFDLPPSALRQPLSQFQITSVERVDLRKLLTSMNRRIGEARLSDDQLGEAFDVWYPHLEKELKSIPPAEVQVAQPSERELLTENLELTQGIARALGLGAQRWADPLRQLLLSLTPREEKTLRMRLGIGEARNYTADEVAEAFEVSPEQVRRIERKAIRKVLSHEPLDDQDDSMGE